ncbi:hypothetical protein PAESOLCIP111_03998 [Paenibacillus solanacearum]|uniref:Uncharacterized protein n=1 Tax=Paenibacillus solanacearum TaxID=2048548 RepID=A0A916K3W7_9BACL|nr:hypothetical protein PAESOLCIP111_03998 [Paenibacillus solanacearum]
MFNMGDEEHHRFEDAPNKISPAPNLKIQTNESRAVWRLLTNRTLLPRHLGRRAEKSALMRGHLFFEFVQFEHHVIKFTFAWLSGSDLEPILLIKFNGVW